MADEYTILESSSDHKMDPVFTSKQWAYQTDQNNLAYASKQITFDLSGFFNSSRFLNPQEMFIAMPVCVGLSAIPASANVGTGDGLGAQPTVCLPIPGSNLGQVTDQFAFGLKSGYWNFINSLQIQVDGKDVIQMVPNINYHASFVANTTFSQSDLAKHGAILGFRPDSSDSWKIFPSADPDGYDGCSRYGWGVTNNSLPPAGSTQVSAFPTSIQGQVFQFASDAATGEVNDGFFERMKQTNKYDKAKYVAGLQNTAYSNAYAQQAADEKEFGQLCLEPYMLSETMTVLPEPAGAGPFVIPQAAAAPAQAYQEDQHCSSSFRQLQLTAVIRMKDICNLFDHLPLTRGLYVRMIVMVNTGYVQLPALGGVLPPSVGAGAVTLPLAAADNAPRYFPGTNASAYSYKNTFTSTCPVMIAPLIQSLGQRATATKAVSEAGAVSFTYAQNGATRANLSIYPGVARDEGSQFNQGYVLSVSIAQPDPIHVQTSLLTAPNLMQPHPMQTCRMYCPVIDLDPIQTSRYLTEHKVQSIFYKDVLQYQQLNVKSGQIVNYQLGNGIVNAQKLIIIPFYHDDTPTDSTVSSVPKLPFEPISPFDSAPATCAPRSCLTNFNVLISNINVFQRNIDYSFENFIEEMSLTNAINGGLDTGLTSGLIDYAKWKDNYRYYVVDLSRRIQGDNTPKSITVYGVNSSKFAVDYYFFVEYRRHLEINVETGHVSVSSN